jgi:hypothetical protein
LLKNYRAENNALLFGYVIFIMDKLHAKAWFSSTKNICQLPFWCGQQSSQPAILTMYIVIHREWCGTITPKRDIPHLIIYATVMALCVARKYLS